MDSKKDTYYSHFSAFILGVLLTGLFVVGATSDVSDSGMTAEPDRAKALSAAVLYADVLEKENLLSPSYSEKLIFTATSSIFATTSIKIVPSATSTLQYGSGEVYVEKAVYTPPPKPKVIEKLIIPTPVVEEVVAPIVEGERVLPEGVYILGNGDYVDSSGAKISGDPYMYNYKPPQEEEYMTTPGGVVMDRFGNIISSPEVIDESLVLIPATIVDIDNPPSTVSPIYIPRLVTLAISQNPFLTCTQLQLYANDKELCQLFKTYEDDYTWIRVDVEEE